MIDAGHTVAFYTRYQGIILHSPELDITYGLYYVRECQSRKDAFGSSDFLSGGTTANRRMHNFPSAARAMLNNECAQHPSGKPGPFVIGGFSRF